MKALRFTPAAIRDLEEIWDYTAANWDEVQAERYIEALEAACRRLSGGTANGRSASTRIPCMKYPCGSHFIYYQEDTISVTVVRVLHRRMDTERHI